MTVFEVVLAAAQEALSVCSVSRSIDRVETMFDDPSLVADAGLIAPATLMVRLGLQALVNDMVRLFDRVVGARPGRKVVAGMGSGVVRQNEESVPDQADDVAGLREGPVRSDRRSRSCPVRAHLRGHVRRGSERPSVFRGAAVRGRALMGRGPAAGEASGDHDLPRPTWDVIPGELVEFFRTRTDVSIMLPGRAA